MQLREIGAVIRKKGHSSKMLCVNWVGFAEAGFQFRR
jgi:hypothetical protein